MARFVLTIALLGIALRADGQEWWCCSNNTTSQLVLSEINLRGVSFSNALEYVRETTMHEHGVKLEVDVDYGSPEVDVSVPPGLGDAERRVLRQLGPQTEKRMAEIIARRDPPSGRLITLSLRGIPVCDALHYIVSAAGEHLVCTNRGRGFALIRLPVHLSARAYKIRREACEELERTLERKRRQRDWFPLSAPTDEIVVPLAYTCLSERGVLIAIDFDENLNVLQAELTKRGWLVPAN